MAEAPGSRTQPSRGQREATDFEDREGHRAPFASIARDAADARQQHFMITHAVACGGGTGEPVPEGLAGEFGWGEAGRRP